ncbi:MAG: MotA/TolQ/ExbB proton channel family protein [Pirellulales bacterium]
MSDIAELARQGGWVMGLIVVVSIAAWSVIAYEWLALGARGGRHWRSVRLAVDRLQHGEPADLKSISHDDPHGNPNVIYSILAARRATAGDDRQSFAAQVAPLLRGESLMRRRSLRIVAMFAAAMPLLGLLGTVLGMTQTFSAFTSRGAPQVHVLADGISQALITTQAGLVATVPVLLAHGLLAARVRRYLDTAEITVKRIESITCRDD